MNVTIRCQPSYSVAYCHLAQGESLLCERGAMMSMSAGIAVHTSTGPGGVIKAALRKKFGGENFFMGRYEAQVDGAWIGLAPHAPGDIFEMPVEPDRPLLIEAGSLLAHTEGLSVDVRFAGLTNIALHEGAVMLKVSGAGQVLLCGYGAIQACELGAGEQMIVDTGHVIAFSAGMDMRVGPLGNVLAAETTGEGLVGQFTGPGLLFLQTRAEQQLRDWLMPGGGELNRKS